MCTFRFSNLPWTETALVTFAESPFNIRQELPSSEVTFITVIMLHTTSATRAATDRMHGSWTNWTLQSLHIVLQWSWFFTYWTPFRFLPLWLHVGNKMQTITISTIYNVNIAINFISNIIFDSFKTTQAVRSAEVAKRGNSVPYLSLIWESWFVCITPQRQRS